MGSLETTEWITKLCDTMGDTLVEPRNSSAVFVIGREATGQTVLPTEAPKPPIS